MEISLRKEIHPDADFYYRCQFEIFDAPCLIWSRDRWASALLRSDVHRIEVDGAYAGHVILEGRARGKTYIADLSLLPEYRGRGIGRRVLKGLKEKPGKLTAFTRKETLPFFLKQGFVLRRTMKDYFSPGADRYYVETA